VKSLTSKDTNSIYGVLSLDSDYVLTLETQLSHLETMAGDSVDFELFRYNPNIGAAILFIVLFTAASILHTYQCVVTKTWFFIAFIVGCWCKSTPESSFDNRWDADTHQQSKSLDSSQYAAPRPWKFFHILTCTSSELLQPMRPQTSPYQYTRFTRSSFSSHLQSSQLASTCVSDESF